VAVEYDTLADVYDWIVPEPLTTPEGSAAAFAPYLGGLEGGARVLDCACGTGAVAVGLALRGCDVVATDASPGMVRRTRALAAEHGAAVDARVARWEELDRLRLAPFDAVLCVGNSLTHAPGHDGRRAALRAMGAMLKPGGLLVVTSRNWELVRAEGPGLRVADELTVRDGVRGLVVYAWSLADDWYDEHHVDVAVALLGDDGTVRTHRERLTFWPFTHETLYDDLRAAGLEPAMSTYATHVEPFPPDRYLVTARRP
jgi:SAM-dependent methyltransferase